MDKLEPLHSALMPLTTANHTSATGRYNQETTLQLLAIKTNIVAKQGHKTIEKLALWGSAVATMMAAVSQQAMFAVPLSLSFGLSLVYRQRLESTVQQHLSTTQKTVAQVQEWVSDLDASAEALHDRTRNLDAWGEQLMALQEWAFTQHQSDRGRVAIFIDGTKLYDAATKFNIEIDYGKLLSFLTGNSPLFRAYCYVAVDGNSQQQQKFLNLLRRHGCRVVAKQIVRRRDGSTKANLDVEIALDMVSLVSAYDTAVLVAVNDDLAYATRAVCSHGTRVEVIGWQSSQSVDLINEADSYTDLETIQQQIS